MRVLTNISWDGRWASFVPVMRFNQGLTRHRSAVHSNFVMAMLTEPDVVRSRTIYLSSFACLQLLPMPTWGVAVTSVYIVNDGWDLP